MISGEAFKDSWMPTHHCLRWTLLLWLMMNKLVHILRGHFQPILKSTKGQTDIIQAPLLKLNWVQHIYLAIVRYMFSWWSIGCQWWPVTVQHSLEYICIWPGQVNYLDNICFMLSPTDIASSALTDTMMWGCVCIAVVKSQQYNTNVVFNYWLIFHQPAPLDLENSPSLMTVHGGSGRAVNSYRIQW